MNPWIQAAIRLDHRLYPKPPLVPGILQKTFEFAFNLVGMSLSFAAIRLGPAPIANRFTEQFGRIQAERTPPPPDEAQRSKADEALALFRHAREKMGREPAVLFLKSHPSTTPDEAPLLGDLVIAALRINAAFGRKFKLVQAVDPFALDQLGWVRQGVYAGLILSGHLPLDRMPGAKPFHQGLLFRRAAYTRMVFRLARFLNEGFAVCAALAGGVTHNARLFYVFKEFVLNLYRCGRRRSLSRRQLEDQAIALLERRGSQACVEGRISAEEKEALLALGRSLDAPEDRLRQLIAELEEELALQTPYRMRFFRAVLGRVAAKGKPLLIIPMEHYAPDRRIAVHEPVLVGAYDRRAETLTVIRNSAAPERLRLEPFVKSFVRSSLNPPGISA